MAASGVKSRLKKQRSKRRRLKIRPRTNLNGGDLVRSTFLVLTFAFALAFMATFVLASCSCLSFPLWAPPLGAVFLPFCWATVKKEDLEPEWSHPLGAFGWVFARAHSDLRSVRMLRPHQLPQTWIDLIQPMMLFVTWPMACTTLTSDGIPEESPVKMRQVFCWSMATRSCRSWCIFLEPGRWGG